MVWGLIPVESFPGAQTYYFFKRGIYKVGRKDCDVIIKHDSGVSRIHAELVVDAMSCQDSLQNISSNFLSGVRIIDKSKYGTFINKEKGSKSVNKLPNKETILKNGDLVSFGTGNAMFRFCFVPLKFFIHQSKSFQMSSSLQDIISSIGACATQHWNSSCTHVLADEHSVVTEDIIDAILAQKPVICSEWLKVIADKNIGTELPNLSEHIPNLTFEGVSIKIVEPKARENSLAGHTFVLGSFYLYKFGERLKPLLELCNGKVLTVDGFLATTQTSTDGVNNNVVLVTPAGQTNEFNHFHQLNSLSRVIDKKLIATIISGHFDPSIMEMPSVVLSLSHSTDETIVADSDVEMDTAASNFVTAAARSEAAVKSEEEETLVKTHDDVTPEKMKTCGSKVEEGGIIQRRDKANESLTSENQNSDVIYSQDLIVRDVAKSSLVRSTSKNKLTNFKCFRKRDTPSGNSFGNLIPFSKNPYKESDCGNEVAEFVRKEKRQKQMESVADDLFNSVKVHRHGTTGFSIRDLLTRR